MPERIVSVGRDGIGALSNRGQPVFRIIMIREGTIVGQVAVAVIGRRHRADGRILIEAIGRMGDRKYDGARRSVE